MAEETVPMPAPWQDPTWQKELDRIAPEEEGVRLHLYWEEGFPWEPINRWMIGTVSNQISPLWREILEGPDPRTMGRYDAVKGEFLSAALCSRRQWDYYQKTGHLLERYWVVQGSRGGHRYQYSQVESRISAIHGGPAQPPHPSDLPYSVPNAVTFESLTNIHALLLDIAVIETKENGLLAADEKGALEIMRRDVWNWMSDQIEESTEELAFHLKGDMHMAPDGDSNAIHAELEATEESFITEGV